MQLERIDYAQEFGDDEEPLSGVPGAPPTTPRPPPLNPTLSLTHSVAQGFLEGMST